MRIRAGISAGLREIRREPEKFQPSPPQDGGKSTAATVLCFIIVPVPIKNKRDWPEEAVKRTIWVKERKRTEENGPLGLISNLHQQYSSPVRGI